MVGGPLLPVHGPSDIHAARHGVDAEDLRGWLVGAHARDAVPDGDVVVFVGPDLEEERGRGRSVAMEREHTPPSHTLICLSRTQASARTSSMSPRRKPVLGDSTPKQQGSTGHRTPGKRLCGIGDTAGPQPPLRRGHGPGTDVPDHHQTSGKTTASRWQSVGDSEGRKVGTHYRYAAEFSSLQEGNGQVWICTDGENTPLPALGREALQGLSGSLGGETQEWADRACSQTRESTGNVPSEGAALHRSPGTRVTFWSNMDHSEP